MKIKQHSYKPRVQFFGRDIYHLGVELEMEAPYGTSLEPGLSLYRRPQFCYAKHDGSLNNGFELVTHPIGKKVWLDTESKKSAAGRFFSMVEQFRKLGYTSHTNQRCGLHIHVSFSAFEAESRDKTKKIHVYGFMRLINSPLFRKLSQRKDDQINRWCKICRVESSNFHTMSEEEGRYLATNLTDNTIEVRLFRGHMREDRIRKAMESVIAAIEYSRKLTTKDYAAFKKNDGLIVKAFLDYIIKNRTVYPNLFNFLVEIEQIKNERPVECV